MFSNSLDFQRDEEREKQKRLTRCKEIQAINQAMHAAKLSKEKKESRRNMNNEIYEACMTKKQLYNEAHDAEDCKKEAQDSITQSNEDQKKFKEDKLKREEDDDAETEVCQKHFDERRCREQEVYAQIREVNSLSTSNNYDNNYDLVKGLQDVEKQAYNDFIEKGTDKKEKELLLKDESDKTEKANQLEKNKELAEMNKKTGEDEKLRRKIEHQNETAYETGILFDNQYEKRNRHHQSDDNSEEPYLSISSDKDKKMREPHWSGAGGAHALDASASDPLQHAQYKHVSRKGDEFRESNYLNESTLPVSKYY